MNVPLKPVEDMSVDELRDEVTTFRLWRQSFSGTQSSASFAQFVAEHPTVLEQAVRDCRVRINELLDINDALRRTARNPL